MFRYSDLLKEVELLKRHGIMTGSIGKTVLGADIPFIYLQGCRHCGSDNISEQKEGTSLEIGKNCQFCGAEIKNIIVTGAIHAREHITALLVLCQIKHILKNKVPLYGGIYFIPMVNPDGVRLCQEGIDFLDSVQSLDAYKRKELKKELVEVNKSVYFGLWKANADCVDLNVNFDADWGRGKQNVFCKSSSDYVGKNPFDQPESRALRDFTLRADPLSTISYHCKGEEIYWNFGQNDALLLKSYRLAKMIARDTNYRLVDNNGSAGGYKDFCIQTLGIPSFTIEVGADKYPHPFPYSQFESILEQNKNIPARILNAAVRSVKAKTQLTAF